MSDAGAGDAGRARTSGTRGDPAKLGDDDLLVVFECAFKRSALDPALFTHRQHVRLAWCWFRRFEFADAAPRFARALRAFAMEHGKTRIYHETITWTLLALIHERMRASASWRDESFDAFLEREPGLARYRGGLLDECVDVDALLASEEARETFVMPRRRATERA